MKMSDVFGGELIHYESGDRRFYGDIARVVGVDGNCTNAQVIASYRDNYDYAVAICLAVNNHDKLVESLREVIDLSKSPREHKEARERASKLLADLENDDE